MLVRSPFSFPPREFSSVELFVLFLPFRYLLVSSMRELDTSFSIVKRVLCSKLRKTLDLKPWVIPNKSKNKQPQPCLQQDCSAFISFVRSSSLSRGPAGRIPQFKAQGLKSSTSLLVVTLGNHIKYAGQLGILRKYIQHVFGLLLVSVLIWAVN